MAKKREKVIVVDYPPIVMWMLKNSTGQQLTYFSQISKSPSFVLFVRLFERFKEYTVYQHFSVKVEDADGLMSAREFAKGQTAAFDAFLIFCQAAQEEITRRKTITKKS